ncbi:DUF2913 family protein, partial [Providencia stuartii]|uniref:DUF2913 family protein n=1 Tax=Providencia stuartii TaxID=588 RepID=UPI0030102E95
QLNNYDWWDIWGKWAQNPWLGKLAYGALVSLALAQYDGKTTRNPHSENLFLLRWLQTALKQKRFHRCVAGDLAWLINLGQQRVMTSKLKGRLEYLWRSCCCDITQQSDLFRLTYATELLKDLGWDSVVVSDDRWAKLTAKTWVAGAVPTFYVVKTVLEAAFDDKGNQCEPVNFWVLGDKRQFAEVMRQHQLQGQWIDHSAGYCLEGADAQWK